MVQLVNAMDTSKNWWINLMEKNRRLTSLTQYSANSSDIYEFRKKTSVFVWTSSWVKFSAYSSRWKIGTARFNTSYPSCGQLNSKGYLEDAACYGYGKAFPICKLGNIID